MRVLILVYILFALLLVSLAIVQGRTLKHVEGESALPNSNPFSKYANHEIPEIHEIHEKHAGYANDANDANVEKVVSLDSKHYSDYHHSKHESGVEVYNTFPLKQSHVHSPYTEIDFVTTLENRKIESHSSNGTFLSSLNRNPLFVDADSDIVGTPCTNQTSRRICKDTHVCLPSGVCGECVTDMDCQLLFGNQEICRVLPENRRICSHKNLFPRISIHDIASMVLNSIGGAMAASSGLGGGGIFVPLLIAVGGFSAKLAIPISKAMIFGASIANFSIFIMRKHPLDNQRPLIDFDTALILEPATLLGTIIGVLLNIIFPEMITLILLIFLLTVTTVRTTQKGLNAWIKESSKLNKTNQEHEYSALDTIQEGFSVDDLMESQEGLETNRLYSDTDSVSDISDDALFDMMKNHENPTKNENPFNLASDLIGTTPAFLDSPNALPPDSTQARIIKLEQRIFPLEKICLLLFCWIIIMIVALLKGGHGAPSIVGIQSCTPIYWLTTFSPYVTIGAIMLIVSYFLISQYKLKKRHRVPFLKGDVKWNYINTLFYPFLCFLAGVAAGALGIGGGLVKAPILVEMGLLPEVVVATSSFMILFTSSITTIQFTILRRLPLDYGIVFMICGFVSAFTGQVISEYLVKKLNRPSMLIMLMAVIIAMSTVLMGGVGIARFYNDVKVGAAFVFSFPC